MAQFAAAVREEAKTKGAQAFALTMPFDEVYVSHYLLRLPILPPPPNLPTQVTHPLFPRCI